MEDHPLKKGYVNMMAQRLFDRVVGGESVVSGKWWRCMDGKYDGPFLIQKEKMVDVVMGLAVRLKWMDLPSGSVERVWKNSVSRALMWVVCCLEDIEDVGGGFGQGVLVAQILELSGVSLQRARIKQQLDDKASTSKSSAEYEAGYISAMLHTDADWLEKDRWEQMRLVETQLNIQELFYRNEIARFMSLLRDFVVENREREVEEEGRVVKKKNSELDGYIWQELMAELWRRIVMSVQFWK